MSNFAGLGSVGRLCIFVCVCCGGRVEIYLLTSLCTMAAHSVKSELQGLEMADGRSQIAWHIREV